MNPWMGPKDSQGDICALTRGQVEPAIHKSGNSVLEWGNSKEERLRCSKNLAREKVNEELKWLKRPEK